MRFGAATAGRGWPGRFPSARPRGHDTPGAEAPGLHSGWRSRLQPRRTGDGKWKRPGQDPRPRTNRLLTSAVLLAVVVCVQAASAQKPVASHGPATARPAAVRVVARVHGAPIT